MRPMAVPLALAPLATAPPASETIKFRTDLLVTRQVQNGEVSYIVKDRATRKYYRFREAEHAILSRLDGATPLSRVLHEVQVKYPHLGLQPEDLARFIASLKKADLLEKSQAEKNLLLVEKLRDQRRAKIKSQANPLARILYLHYHLVDPDSFFEGLMPYIRWMWHPAFVWGSLALFAFAAFLNLRGGSEIAAGITALYRFQGYQWYDYAQLWGFSIAAIVLHEFGHGLTCKRFGGEVHDLGFLLIFFNPAMYCNVSDAYLFENRWHKLYVTAAGGFVELWIWSAASVAWASTFPGTAIHDLAFKLMVVSGISTLAFNFNPLMKLDGYYALVDFLGVANLRDNSFEFLRTWLKRNVFGLNTPPMDIEPRLARIYAIYGTLSALFGAAMLVFMFFLFRNLILGKLHAAGIPLFLALMYTLYGGMVMNAWKFLKSWSVEKREVLMKRSVQGGLAGAGLAAVAVVIFGQAPARIHESFVLEPAMKLGVRAAIGGRVAEVRVDEGDRVSRGQVVARLVNADLASAAQVLMSDRRKEELARAQARLEGDLAALAASEARLARLRAAEAKARADLAALELRAPVAGVVLTSRPRDRVGDEIIPGEALVEVGDVDTLCAQIGVSENEIGEVRPGERAELAFKALPGRHFEGRIEAIALAGEAGGGPARASRPLTRFRVTVMVPNPDGALRPGMSGEAKIYGPRRPLYRLAARWAGKTFNPDFW